MQVRCQDRLQDAPEGALPHTLSARRNRHEALALASALGDCLASVPPGVGRACDQRMLSLLQDGRSPGGFEVLKAPPIEARGTVGALGQSGGCVHGPRRHLLGCGRLPGGDRFYDLPCSIDFAMRRGRLLQFRDPSLSPCGPFPPAGVAGRLSVVVLPHEAFLPISAAPRYASFPVDSLRVRCIPLVRSSRGLGAFAKGSIPHVDGFPARRLLRPIRHFARASEFRPGSPLSYCPLPFTSLVKLPVFTVEDSSKMG